jgi:hypothetical protein
VPFQLGRPIGGPSDPAFQKRVLMAAFRLLDASEGPVLEDFPEDEPENDEITVLACPVSFARTTDKDVETDEMKLAFQREITAMRPWYQIAIEKRQRTTVGTSGIDLDKLSDFIYAFLKGDEPENPRDDTPLSNTLKLAVEDLKSYYIEGITAQPGQENTSSRALRDWFWDETVAGKVLLELKKVCEASPDKTTSEIGSHGIVPEDVIHRRGL